jgi:hypothetical protein
MDSEWNASALMPKSLSWDRSSFVRATVRYPRLKFGNGAVAWQLAGQRGGWTPSAPLSTSPRTGDPRGRTRTESWSLTR